MQYNLKANPSFSLKGNVLRAPLPVPQVYNTIYPFNGAVWVGIGGALVASSLATWFTKKMKKVVDQAAVDESPPHAGVTL